MKIKVSKLAKINSDSFNKDDLPEIIKYIDTSSMTENIISNIQIFNSSRDSIPSRARRKVKNNTIIYSSVRPRNNHFGIFEKPGENVVVSTGYITLDAYEDIVDPYYLYIIITLPRYLEYIYKVADSAVSSYPSITPEDLGNMEVDIVEDIKEQEKIASFMRKLDRIIINNNKCNNKIYDLIFDTYNYWFNQFGYNENVELIYNETLKKKIPYDWCTDTVGSIIKETKNGDWGVEEYNEDTVESHCVRGTDLDSLINVFADIPNRLIVKKSFESKKVLYGDLIVEMSGGSSTQSTGRIAYVNDVTLKRYDNLLISSNFCKVISLKNQNYYAWFFCMWNNLYQSGVFFNYEGKTSGIKNLLYDDFVNNVFILIPSKEIVDKFNSIAIPLLNKVQKNINDNKYLINLKLEMFDSLINGQLKIVD